MRTTQAIRRHMKTYMVTFDFKMPLNITRETNLQTFQYELIYKRTACQKGCYEDRGKSYVFRYCQENQ